MTATLMIEIADEDLRMLLRAAEGEGVALGEMARLIVRGALAVYRVEDRDGKPAGPMSAAVRAKHWQFRRWRVDSIATERALDEAALPAPSLGDPPPGRSALDARAKTEAAGR